MKIDRRDWLFICFVVVVAGIFLAISGSEKTRVVPDDEMHGIVYKTAYRSAPAPDSSIFRKAFFRPDKKGAETFCEPCHNLRGVPYPPGHPQKNRCLFCHKLKKKL